MSCPKCKMKIGWGPVVSNTGKAKAWYKPTKNELKCAHCGAVVKTKGKHDQIQLILLIVAVLSFSTYISPGCVNNCNLIAIFICVASVVLLFVNAVTKKYEIIK